MVGLRTAAPRPKALPSAVGDHERIAGTARTAVTRARRRTRGGTRVGGSSTPAAGPRVPYSKQSRSGIAAIHALMRSTPKSSASKLGSSGILISGSVLAMRCTMMLSSG